MSTKGALGMVPTAVVIGFGKGTMTGRVSIRVIFVRDTIIPPIDRTGRF